MTIYDIVIIWRSAHHIESTNSNALDWIENELRRRFSRYVVRTQRTVGLESGSKKFDDRVAREFQNALVGTDWQWEMMTEFLHQGWEPFSATNHGVYLRWRQDI